MKTFFELFMKQGMFFVSLLFLSLGAWAIEIPMQGLWTLVDESRSNGANGASLRIEKATGEISQTPIIVPYYVEVYIDFSDLTISYWLDINNDGNININEKEALFFSIVERDGHQTLEAISSDGILFNFFLVPNDNSIAGLNLTDRQSAEGVSFLLEKKEYQ